MTVETDRTGRDPAPCRLTFLVPLRPRAQTRDWSLVSRLCMATIRSCLKNPSPGIRVLLVGHETPEGFDTLNDPRKSFLRSDAGLPAAFEGTPGMQDKWSKIFQGLVEIARDPPDYFMFVDADDLVSERLYDFLNASRPPNGAICKDGYRYEIGSRHIKLVKDRFNCGTNAVIAARAVAMPTEVSKEARARCAPLRAGHSRIEEEMATIGHPLTRIPFPAVVHILHAEQHTRAHAAPRQTPVAIAKRKLRKLVNFYRDHRRLQRASSVLTEFSNEAGARSHRPSGADA